MQPRRLRHIGRAPQHALGQHGCRTIEHGHGREQRDEHNSTPAVEPRPGSGQPVAGDDASRLHVARDLAKDRDPQVGREQARGALKKGTGENRTPTRRDERTGLLDLERQRARTLQDAIHLIEKALLFGAVGFDGGALVLVLLVNGTELVKPGLDRIVSRAHPFDDLGSGGREGFEVLAARNKVRIGEPGAPQRNADLAQLGAGRIELLHRCRLSALRPCGAARKEGRQQQEAERA